jgi:hypothetical protein
VKSRDINWWFPLLTLGCCIVLVGIVMEWRYALVDGSGVIVFALLWRFEKRKEP